MDDRPSDWPQSHIFALSNCGACQKNAFSQSVTLWSGRRPGGTGWPGAEQLPPVWYPGAHPHCGPYPSLWTKDKARVPLQDITVTPAPVMAPQGPDSQWSISLPRAVPALGPI